jgi:CBS-domain-containing membrane protein
VPGNVSRTLQRIRILWKAYVLQTCYATAAMFIVFSTIDIGHMVIIASVGATVFILFALPRNVTALPRNVVGGQYIGLLCGSLWSMVPHEFADIRLAVLIYSCAVGSSFFLMVITDTEHPPAAGTALGVVAEGFSWSMCFSFLVCIPIFSLIHMLMKKHLKTLVFDTHYASVYPITHREYKQENIDFIE